MTPFSLSALISAIIAGSLGVFVFLKNRKNHINIAFCLLSLSIATWSLGLSREIVASIKVEGIFWGQVLRTGMIFIPSSYFYFISALLNINNKNRIKIIFFYFISLLFLFINFKTSLLVKDTIPRPEFGFNYWAVPNYLYIIFLFFFFGLILYSIHLVIKSFKELSFTRQNQFKYVLLASAVGFIGGSSTFLPTFKINVYPVLNYFFALYVVITAYAITRHRLMDIEVIIRKGTVYSIVVGLFTGVYLIAVFLISQIFQNFTRENSLFIVIPVLLIFAIIFQPVKNRVQEVIDKLFLRQKYDYQKTIRELSEATTSVVDLDALLQLVSKTVVERVKVEGASVYVLKESGKDYILRQEE